MLFFCLFFFPASPSSSDNMCDFDHGLCGWTLDSSAPLLWSTHRHGERIWSHSLKGQTLIAKIHKIDSRLPFWRVAACRRRKGQYQNLDCRIKIQDGHRYKSITRPPLSFEENMLQDEVSSQQNRASCLPNIQLSVLM